MQSVECQAGSSALFDARGVLSAPLPVLEGCELADRSPRHVDAALTLLRTLRATAVKIRLADTAPRPHHCGRPAGLTALDRPHAEVATPPPAGCIRRQAGRWVWR